MNDVEDQVCSVCIITLRKPKVHLHCLYCNSYIQQRTWQMS